MTTAMYVVQMENDGRSAERLPRIMAAISKRQPPSNSDNSAVSCIIGSRSVHPDAISITEYFIQMWRHFHLHGNERQVVLGVEDHLVVVQLCLAGINKEKVGDFDVETSKVLQMHQRLCRSKLANVTDPGDLPASQTTEYTELRSAYDNFLKSCNMVDAIDVLSAVKVEFTQNEELRKMVSGLVLTLISKPQSAVETSMLEFLSDQESSVTVCRVCERLSSEDTTLDMEVEFEPRSLDEAITVLEDIPRSSTSVTEAYVEGLLVSYLVLLINSRSEIAMARTLNVPDRELDHKAFTCLKKAAQDKGLSMYQTASSFILKIRLGGRGYAPSSDCTLSPYVKGLGEYVNLIHKLQTIIEEETDTSKAVHRVITCVGNTITKHRENVLRKQSVEVVADRLRQRAESIMKVLADKKYESPNRDTSSGGSVLGRDTLRVLRHLVDVQAGLPMQTRSVDVLSDAVSSQRTPLRFNSLLSQFRSPVEASPESKLNQSLAERMLRKMNRKDKKSSVPRFQANYDWACPAQDIGLSKNTINYTLTDIVPSKTVVHAAPADKPRGPRRLLESRADQENELSDLSIITEVEKYSNSEKNMDTSAATIQRGEKRPLDQQNLAQPPNKKSKQSLVKPNKGRTKKLPLQKGQKQLTAFFRV